MTETPSIEKRLGWLDTEMNEAQARWANGQSGDVDGLERVIERTMDHQRLLCGLVREMHQHYVSRQPMLGEATSRSEATEPPASCDMGQGSREQAFAGQTQGPFIADGDSVHHPNGHIFCWCPAPRQNNRKEGRERAKLIALALNAHPEGRLAASLNEGKGS
jgi:hypothetical protein